MDCSYIGSKALCLARACAWVDNQCGDQGMVTTTIATATASVPADFVPSSDLHLAIGLMMIAVGLLFFCCLLYCCRRHEPVFGGQIGLTSSAGKPIPTQEPPPTGQATAKPSSPNRAATTKLEPSSATSGKFLTEGGATSSSSTTARTATLKPTAPTRSFLTRRCGANFSEALAQSSNHEPTTQFEGQEDSSSTFFTKRSVSTPMVIHKRQAPPPPTVPPSATYSTTQRDHHTATDRTTVSTPPSSFRRRTSSHITIPISPAHSSSSSSSLHSIDPYLNYPASTPLNSAVPLGLPYSTIPNLTSPQHQLVPTPSQPSVLTLSSRVHPQPANPSSPNESIPSARSIHTNEEMSMTNPGVAVNIAASSSQAERPVVPAPPNPIEWPPLGQFFRRLLPARQAKANHPFRTRKD